MASLQGWRGGEQANGLVAGLSDQRYIGNVDNDAQVCPVTNQLFQATADFGYQKAIFQRITLVFGATLDLLEDPLVQADNFSYVFIEIHGVLK